MLTAGQRRFAELFAAGANGMEAYGLAFGHQTAGAPACRRRTLAARACALRKKPELAALIERLRQPEQQSPDPPDVAAAAITTPAVADGRGRVLLLALDSVSADALAALGDLELRRVAAHVEHLRTLVALELEQRKAPAGDDADGQPLP